MRRSLCVWVVLADCSFISIGSLRTWCISHAMHACFIHKSAYNWSWGRILRIMRSIYAHMPPAITFMNERCMYSSTTSCMHAGAIKFPILHFDSDNFSQVSISFFPLDRQLCGKYYSILFFPWTKSPALKIGHERWKLAGTLLTRVFLIFLHFSSFVCQLIIYRPIFRTW